MSRLIERRYGISRTVFLVGRWAVKVPRVKKCNVTWTIPRAMLANQSELEWKGVEGIAPVLWSGFGGLVNVYPRCEAYPQDGPEPDYDAIGVGWMPRDRKRENIGMLNGELVWMDYDGSWNGCPHSRNAAGLTTDDDD